MQKKKKLSDEELLTISGGEEDGVDLDDVPDMISLNCPGCGYEIVVSEIGYTPQYCPNCNLKLEDYDC